MKHRVKFGNASHALTTDLETGHGVPTAATVELKDLDGGCLFAGGVITGAYDGGGGLVGFTYTGTGPGQHNYVNITGTTSYDGDYLVAGDDGSLFTITETYVDNETGAFTVQKAATVLTSTTLAAAATRGKGAITLASVTGLSEGSIVRIAMSADGGDEDVKITAVNTSTKVCELADYLKFSHASGAVVTGRFLSYDLDASDTAVFTSGLDFNVIWNLFDTDDLAWREDGEILKREVAFGGLAQKFATLYPHYFTQIPDGEFEVYQDAAFNDLRILFVWKAQRDLDKLVNPDDLEPVLLRQIAYNIAFAGDDSWEKEQNTMKTDRDDWLTRMSQAQIWIDEDGDDTEDDSEKQTMAFALPRRQL